MPHEPLLECTHSVPPHATFLLLGVREIHRGIACPVQKVAFPMPRGASAGATGATSSSHPQWTNVSDVPGKERENLKHETSEQASGWYYRLQYKLQQPKGTFSLSALRSM